MSISDLPHVNAALNTLAAILLVVGHHQIKRKRVAAHKACMLSATGVSAAFLTSYLIYHYAVGSVRFAHGGALRTVYLAILGSHTILAAMVPILVVITLWRALKGDFVRHRRIARWTYPIWLYVSVTGVVVYLMLYQLFPGPRP
ncbi:MAG TPA: DUF420 domain-containing protein [Phycisphaerae bacterium]|nr:DUF420 domain-containing protein [Phycisphaerae bacterium]